MSEMTFQSVGPVAMESVSAVTATPSQNLGERLFWKGEEYVYCYNAGGGAIDKLDGVKFITAASGYSVAATSITDVFNPCVGVAKHATIAAGSYGWIMTKGYTNVNVVSACTADYKMIALGAGGSFIEASGTTTLGTAVAVGHVMNANTGAGGLAYAFIRTGA